MPRFGSDLCDSLRGVYVLVVNADAETRALLTAVLRYCAAYVHAVPSLAEALAAMTHMVPDALVVDATMAEEDACAFIREVRALKPPEGGMVVAVGLGSHDGQREARTRGFDGYLQKPVDPWSLCELIAGLVAR